MNNAFPPPDFVPTESAVSGITIFKPKPPEDYNEVVNFTCPNCAATTAFSTDNGGLTCAHCGYHEAPEAEQVGRSAEEFEFTVETLHRSVHGWGEERKELVCNNCAVHTTLSVSSLTHACPFCGSNNVMQMKAAQDVLRPRFIVPFSVTTEQCRETTAVWLQDSWMLPDRLTQLGRSTDYVPLYLPYWTFDARAYANWKAEERHGSGDDATWKKVKGKVQLYFDDVLVLGSNHIEHRLMNQIRNFDLQALVNYSPDFLAGIQAQAYEIPLEKAWQEARTRMRLRTKKECQEQIRRRYRNFQMELDFQDESWRYMLLPVYIAAFSYGDKRYQVLINGQTGKIAGQRPVDRRKVLNWIAKLTLPAVAFAILMIIVSQLPMLAPDYQEAGGALFLLSLFYLFGVAVYSGYLFWRATKLQSGDA